MKKSTQRSGKHIADSLQNKEESRKQNQASKQENSEDDKQTNSANDECYKYQSHSANPNDKMNLYFSNHNHLVCDEHVLHVGPAVNKLQHIHNFNCEGFPEYQDAGVNNSKLLYVQKANVYRVIQKQQHVQNSRKDTISNPRYKETLKDHDFKLKHKSSISSEISSSISSNFFSDLDIKQKKVQNKQKQLQNSNEFCQMRKNKKKKKHYLKQQQVSRIRKSNFSKMPLVVNSNEIIDSRKNPDIISLTSQQSVASLQSICSIPKQRIVTFVLIYQVPLTHLVITSLMEADFWILVCTNFQYRSVLIFLIFPTYFGVKCISEHKLKQDLIGAAYEQPNKRVSNSFYLVDSHGQNKIQKISTDSLSFLKKSKSKIHPMLQNQQYANQSMQANSINNSTVEQNSQISLFQKYKEGIPYSKNLIIIPYLHEHQMQHFTKCLKCRTSHTNSRIKHCSSCGVCHYGYDHYCKWLATCIDATNYKHFIRFLTTLWVISFVLIIYGAYIEYQCVISFDTKVYIVIMAFVQLELILSLVFCSYILIYHIWLNMRGVSTRQHFSGIKQNSNNSLFCKSLTSSIPHQYYNNFIDYIPTASAADRWGENGTQIQVQSLTKSRFFNAQSQLQQQTKTDQQNECIRNHRKLRQIDNISEQQEYSQKSSGTGNRQATIYDQPPSVSIHICDKSNSKFMLAQRRRKIGPQLSQKDRNGEEGQVRQFYLQKDSAYGQECNKNEEYPPNGAEINQQLQSPFKLSPKNAQLLRR